MLPLHNVLSDAVASNGNTAAAPAPAPAAPRNPLEELYGSPEPPQAQPSMPRLPMCTVLWCIAVVCRLNGHEIGVHSSDLQLQVLARPMPDVPVRPIHGTV